MPAKAATICYVHQSKERLTQEYTVKEITGVTRTDNDDPSKIIYLKIKAFIPSDKDIECKIEDFEVGQVIFLKGKFIAAESWYIVNATSIKLIPHLDFDAMPSIGLSATLIGLTTKTVTNVDGQSVLNFYVEENLGEREPREFWVEVVHNPNNKYLSNKTNSINQTVRSTTAVLVGTIHHELPVIDEATQELTPGKHVLNLEDISLISINRENLANQQSVNVPWLNPQKNNTRTPRGATPRAPKRSRTTLAQMGSTSTISAVIESNPVPASMSNEGTSEE